MTNNAIEVYPTRPSFFDPSNGLLAEGFSYTFYASDKTTLKNIWLEPTRVTVAANPLVVDSTATIPFLYGDTDDDYWVVIKDETENIIQSFSLYTKTSSGASDATSTNNYIPNGQFVSHFVLPADATHVEGEIREDDTAVAIGGWHYFREGGTGSKDIITFERSTIPSSLPNANPRYAINISNESGGSSYTKKDLQVRFSNVRRFASATQAYTFSFVAKTNNASTTTLKVYLYRYYGVGGTTPAGYTLVEADLTITPVYEKQVVTINYGEDTGTNVGDNDDDFIAISLQMPLTSTFDISITDALQYIGTVADPAYPVTTDRHALALSSFQNNTPTYNGSNLYLPMVMTKEGLTPDNSVVGNIEYKSYPLPSPNTEPYLSLNGDKYEYSNVSDLGIPYQRLGDKLWDATNNVYLHNTGRDYFVAVQIGTTAQFQLQNNAPGSVSAVAPGTSTFTVDTVHTSDGNGYYVRSYMIDTNIFTIEVKNAPADLAAGPYTTFATANTSGFTMTPVSPPLEAATQSILPITNILTTDAASLAVPGGVGKYFEFSSENTGVQQYFVWYQITNETVPAGTGTAIKVNLIGTDTAEIVCQKTASALQGGETTFITAVDGATVPQSSYWTCEAGDSGGQYYVWYNKDSSGVDPAQTGTGIEIAITGSDTAAQVAVKTIQGINRKYFAVPDVRGCFIRALDQGAGIDKEAAKRYSYIPGLYGDNIGSYQYEMILRHSHSAINAEANGTGNPSAAGPGVGLLDSGSGGSQNNPYSIAMNAVIRY